VQTAERSEPANGDRDRSRHARHDSRIEKDPPAAHFADIDQRGLLIALPAPTEPQVTNVTPASTARVAIGDDKRVPVWVLLEPVTCLVIEYDGELVHYEIMLLAISEPLNLDPGCSGIVDHRCRLEAGA
jgi:hypothetical protein